MPLVVATADREGYELSPDRKLGGCEGTGRTVAIHLAAGHRGPVRRVLDLQHAQDIATDGAWPEGSAVGSPAVVLPAFENADRRVIGGCGGREGEEGDDGIDQARKKKT